MSGPLLFIAEHPIISLLSLLGLALAVNALRGLFRHYYWRIYLAKPWWKR